MTVTKRRLRSKDVFQRVPRIDVPHDKIIRIDGEVYEHIKGFAIPLKDTPNMVLRRLLGLDPKLSPEENAKTANGQQL